MKYPTSMKFMMFLSFFRHCHPCQSDRSPKLFKERRPRDQETMATMGLPGGIYTSLGPFRGSWISGWLVFFLGGIIRMIRGWDKYDQYMIFISFLSRDLAVWTNGALWFQALPSADVLGALRLRWQVEGSHIFPSDNSDYYLFWSGTSVSWCFFVLNKLQSYRGQTGKADSNSAFADFGRPPKEWQGALLSTHLKGSQGKLLMHDLCLGPWCLASDLKLIDLLTHWPCCFVMFYTEAQENKGKKSFRLQCLPAFESSRKSHSEFVSAAFRLGLW
jgi:hypothetical protein